MPDPRPKLCTAPARCPICHSPNACRLETGEPYKGPCWCEKIVLSAEAQRRLAEEIPEPRCLCAACLATLAAEPNISWSDLASRK